MEAGGARQGSANLEGLTTVEAGQVEAEQGADSNGARERGHDRLSEGDYLESLLEGGASRLRV